MSLLDRSLLPVIGMQRTEDFGATAAFLQWTKSIGGGSITGSHQQRGHFLR
jgi:hypothetical protein